MTQRLVERATHDPRDAGEAAPEDPAIRVFGEAAVTIARHIRRASYKGQPADGQFRTSHIAVRLDRRWLLAGIHLSPIGGPPPFARPAEQTAGEGTPPIGASGQ